MNRDGPRRGLGDPRALLRAARKVAPEPAPDAADARRFSVTCRLRSCSSRPLALRVSRDEADAAVAAHHSVCPSHTPAIREVT